MDEDNGGVAASLLPVHVDGDGNCLFHSVSRALIGFETLYHVLRVKVFEELRVNREWYVRHLFFGAAEMFDADLINAEQSGVWAPVTHLVALANVIRRPIALLCSLEDLAAQPEKAGSAVYLPARHEAHECCSHPLLLAWASGEYNHYVPLCRNGAAGHPAAPTLPERCRPQRGVPLNFAVETFIPVGCWRLTGTPKEHLPANALVQAGRYEQFTRRLVERAAHQATAAVNALPPGAAARALTSDDFMGEAQRDAGMLSLSACVALEATRRYCLFSTGERDEFLDGVCAQQFDALADGLASDVAKCALHVCLLKELRMKLCELLALMQAQLDALSTVRLRINIRIVEESLEDAEAELDAALLLATMDAMQQQPAGQAALQQRAPSASVNVHQLMQRLVSHAHSPPPRFAQPCSQAEAMPSGCDDSAIPRVHLAALTQHRLGRSAASGSGTAAATAPLRATSSWPGPPSPSAMAAAGAEPAGEPALGPAKSAPAAGALKRLFSASEQQAAAAESVIEKRIRVLQRQGSNVDARTPVEQLFEMPPPPSSADAAAAKEQPAAMLVPEPTADDEDAASRDLHAALLLSMMPEKASADGKEEGDAAPAADDGLDADPAGAQQE